MEKQERKPPNPVAVTRSFTKLSCQLKIPPACRVGEADKGKEENRELAGGGVRLGEKLEENVYHFLFICLVWSHHMSQPMETVTTQLKETGLSNQF